MFTLHYMTHSKGSNFKLDGAFRLEDNNQSSNLHKDTNDLQTKISVFNILFDVYKILSIELHRRNRTSFVTCCPTCTDGYLMKVEFQSFLDSIRKCLPFNNLLLDGDDDPLRFEKMLPGCVTFMET